MNRVSVRPELLRWARERARIERDALVARFPRLSAWERGERQPTLTQLEAFARATHTPVGFLFLSEPPEERVPIPDFRTIADQAIGRPSPELLDTLYISQERQQWYREFARALGEEPLAWVGSVRLGTDVEAVAAEIRETLCAFRPSGSVIPEHLDQLFRSKWISRSGRSGSSPR